MIFYSVEKQVKSALPPRPAVFFYILISKPIRNPVYFGMFISNFIFQNIHYIFYIFQFPKVFGIRPILIFYIQNMLRSRNIAL